jgi:hypothetical protein
MGVYMLINSAPWEVEVRGSHSEAGLGKSTSTYLKN